eukprot:gene77-77_t
MLNDQVRNSAYFNAIKAALSSYPNCEVLDIGGGSGLLSIYAVLAGASHVYCCEVSKPLSDIAKQIISDHAFNDKITVIPKHSYDLQIGQDLKERVSVIVTELVDSGLLGEHIVSVLADARSRLLRPDGLIIPHSATLYGYPLCSRTLRNRQRIELLTAESNEYENKGPEEGQRPSTSPSRLAISDLIGDLFTSTTQPSHPSLPPLLQVAERYTCESLTTLDHTPLAPPLELASVVFAEPSGGPAVGESTSLLCSDMALTFTHWGRFDGFAYWFNLRLLPPELTLPTEERSGHDSVPSTCWHKRSRSRGAADSSSDNRFEVCTCPDRERCGWDQAVVFACHIPAHGLPAEDERLRHTKPLTVLPGQQCTLSVTVVSDHVLLSMTPRDSDRSVLPCHDPYSGARAQWVKDEQDKASGGLGEMDMAQLNDRSRWNVLVGALLSAVAAVNDCVVYELGSSSWVPVSAVLLALAKRALSKSSLYRRLHSGEGSWWIQSLVAVGGLVQSGRISARLFGCSGEKALLVDGLCSQWGVKDTCAVVPDDVFNFYISHGTGGEERGTRPETATSVLDEALPSSVAVVVCDLVEGCGLLEHGLLMQLQYLYQRLTCSSSDGDGSITGAGVEKNVAEGGGRMLRRRVVVLPADLTVVLSAVECPSLLTQNVVDDMATAPVGECGEGRRLARVCQRINPFGAVLLRELDLSCMRDL